MARLTSDELANAIPDLLSSQSLSGLRESVETHRDAWGIPHIKATNEWDLFFAQGFITAQDRLWHMDADRYRALGRWSEFAGESGLAQDKLLRAAGMGRSSKLDYEVASDEAKAMIDAYTAGVNAFIESDQPLPVEYGILGLTPEKWENWHCIINYKMRNSLLGTFEAKLLRTKLVGQVADRLDDGGVHLAGVGKLARQEILVDGLEEGSALIFVSRGADGDPVPALAAPQLRLGKVTGDCVEPGRHLLDGRILVLVAETTQEGLLHDVLRRLAVADEAAHEVVEGYAVATYEDAELVGVVSGRSQDGAVRELLGRIHDVLSLRVFWVHRAWRSRRGW